MLNFKSQWHNALGFFVIGATTKVSILAVIADGCTHPCGWTSPVLVVIIGPLLVQLHSTQVAAWAAIQVNECNMI